MRPIWPAFIAAGLTLLGLTGPLTATSDASMFAALGVTGLLLALFALGLSLVGRVWTVAGLLPVGVAGAFLTVWALMPLEVEASWGYWTLFWGHVLITLSGVGRVSLAEETLETSFFQKRLKALLPPAAVPFLLLLLWQGLVVGFDVPKGIFPSVVDVWRSLTASAPVLLADAYVTFVKEVLFGFAIGLAAGFGFGVAIAYSSFLQRGFLPLAAAFGAVPIVGLAPVLGRAFGVDWESKAAVVVIVTFFPVVLNTVQGLVRVDPLKLELLKAYAAGPREVFFKLRLPNALPYLFNALKFAAVLSVVSVIVAEFLIPGPPVGLGQRISLSARRGAFDVVFAAIFVSSLISIILYGLLSVLEKRLSGWHASFREEGV